MPDSTIADDLKAARALLEKGWCKYVLERDGSYCALGAINMAAGGASDYSGRLGQGAYDAIRRLLPGNTDVADFNNAPDTTQQDVLDLFEKALAELGALA